jgi:glucan-binding YG repeat protein
LEQPQQLQQLQRKQKRKPPTDKEQSGMHSSRKARRAAPATSDDKEAVGQPVTAPGTLQQQAQQAQQTQAITSLSASSAGQGHVRSPRRVESPHARGVAPEQEQKKRKSSDEASESSQKRKPVECRRQHIKQKSPHPKQYQ